MIANLESMPFEYDSYPEIPPARVSESGENSDQQNELPTSLEASRRPTSGALQRWLRA
jgi:hypothetical protein